MQSRSVLGTRIDATNYSDAVTRVLTWAGEAESRYVCVSNVHVTMEAYDSAEYRKTVNEADIVTPDGMPLVWALRLLGIEAATQVRGPTLTMHLLERAAGSSTPVGFYGGSPEVLETILKVCRARFPMLKVAYAFAPPFRPLTASEDAVVVGEINQSAARILFVGLGCPKQEGWMSSHKGSVNAVMLGVGAAFDILAGAKSEAPSWMQRTGLEWCFRLIHEPSRLWRRYAYHNPRFVILFARQYLNAVTTI